MGPPASPSRGARAARKAHVSTAFEVNSLRLSAMMTTADARAGPFEEGREALTADADPGLKNLACLERTTVGARVVDEGDGLRCSVRSPYR
jgi:hypothetical protein